VLAYIIGIPGEPVLKSYIRTLSKLGLFKGYEFIYLGGKQVQLILFLKHLSNSMVIILLKYPMHTTHVHISNLITWAGQKIKHALVNKDQTFDDETIHS
jgi:hypothetical protein